MRIRVSVLALVVALVACGSSGDVTDPCDGVGHEARSTTEVLTSGGVDYDLQLFVPFVEDGVALPLVIDFHGLGSDGPTQAAFSSYTVLAADEGFAVANPTGPPAIGDTRNSWEVAQFDHPARDDVAMVVDLIDHVAARACIDETRVYATGMSNGGYFSSLLACRLADRVAATFSVAAISHPDDCEPARPIAMGAIHGTADQTVPYGGGRSPLAPDDQSDGTLDRLFSQVIPDEAAEFAADFGCTAVTDTVVGDDTTLRVHGDCDGDVEVHFYAVEGGGHTWPGSPLAGVVESSLGYATDDIDATEVSWAFMSRYSLPSPPR